MMFMTMGLSIQLVGFVGRKIWVRPKGTRFQPVSLVRNPVGVSRKTLPMMKFPNGVCCLFQRRSLRQSLRPMLLIVTGWRTMLNIKGGNVCVFDTVSVRRSQLHHHHGSTV